MSARRRGGERKAKAGGRNQRASASSGTFSRQPPSPASPAEDAVSARPRPAPGLYLVATPIGNAQDVTLRALGVLRAADVIACEDTRVTSRLLAIHDISAPLLAYHDHNAASAGPRLIERLKNGEIVALVSDAGTPLISDPGFRLVAAAILAEINVVPIPGASALLAGLMVAGLPTDRFLFAGFPPPRPAARRRMLEELAGVGASLVLLESPHRLAASLADMADVLGPRPAAIGRELTKRFEEVIRGDLASLAAHFAEGQPARGEIVVVVGPPEAAPAAGDDAVDAALATALGELSPKSAARIVADLSGRPRREVYARALQLAKRE